MAAPSSDFLDAVYVHDPSIVARKIADEMILVPIRQNVGDLESIYLLNETALFAWERFDGMNTLAEICAHLTAEFDVDEREARQDLIELVQHLESVGAIKKV